MNHSRSKVAFAKKLRHSQTDTEKLLWSRLRNRQILGRKFRRQEPIGIYIVDFVNIENKLIIELDGGQHNNEKMRYNDALRTEFLESQGYKVLRFWDNDVFKNIDSVLESIALALTLSLSHGERET